MTDFLILKEMRFKIFRAHVAINLRQKPSIECVVDLSFFFSFNSTSIKLNKALCRPYIVRVGIFVRLEEPNEQRKEKET